MWVTHTENVNFSSHNSMRKVIQYNLDGITEIARFESRIEASIKTGTNNTSISKCCNGKQKSANNFIWKDEI